eukprot:CAMPEP_0202958376 /NCGR_PEP_ID=MMETSP1396-20130829/2733_1 /ASSEMBLY_ACC=CAM_ASM_000872 /TAXON_ID= /ORGANISM="Pseudokeronopsis sp., Strain Brazil" /LENGTH=81 /DNA_ID=CAMNT_0049676423 /DNA_START=888 /DNA_END=1133 /DNA_ORIENTATION=-
MALYSSGIMSDYYAECTGKELALNHAVVIVGFGSVERVEGAPWCEQYWIVKNSFGTTWGESGYFRMCMDYAGNFIAPYGMC